MKILLTDAGKRFNREWIFRHFNYTFEEGQSYAIIGPNGSGKSTLLQVLSGSMMLSEGNVQYSVSNAQYSIETIYQHVSIGAPYMEVVEEMTLKEFLSFHGKLKPLLPSFSITEIASILGLEKAINKEIRYYSSGMKQRLKLGQAIFSDVPVVLLDEPCTNLDADGIQLYHRLINEHCKKRVLIISSNDVQEYGFCEHVIDIRKV